MGITPFYLPQKTEERVPSLLRFSHRYLQSYTLRSKQSQQNTALPSPTDREDGLLDLTAAALVILLKHVRRLSHFGVLEEQQNASDHPIEQ